MSGGALATTDLAGTPTGTVAAISAARQMALTPDGSQLVVADADGLVVVDAATATLLRTIATGANSCPDAVAPAAGKIFFTYGNCTGGTPGMGAVDLTNDSVAKNIATGAVVLGNTNMMLRSVGAAPDMLVLAGATVAVLDATGGATPTLAVRTSRTFAGAPGPTIAVNPAGTEAVTGGGYGQHMQAHSTTDLSSIRSYPLDHGDEVALRSDGRLAPSGPSSPVTPSTRPRRTSSPSTCGR